MLVLISESVYRGNMGRNAGVRFPDEEKKSQLQTMSRDSDWLRVGRLRGRGSSPGRVKNFHFSMLSRPALASTQPPIQWVPGALSWG
jgi:hypothetical protein